VYSDTRRVSEAHEGSPQSRGDSMTNGPLEKLLEKWKEESKLLHKMALKSDLATMRNSYAGRAKQLSSCRQQLINAIKERIKL
jgi:hypothetical protein